MTGEEVALARTDDLRRPTKRQELGHARVNRQFANGAVIADHPFDIGDHSWAVVFLRAEVLCELLLCFLDQRVACELAEFAPAMAVRPGNAPNKNGCRRRPSVWRARQARDFS